MMATARIGLQLVPRISLGGLSRTLAKLSDLSRPLATCIPLIRQRVALEFAQGAWFMPSGGTRPWPTKKPFGKKAAGRQGISTGDYFRALQGGAGAIARVTPQTLTVGADAGRFPYAKYMRGGTGARISLADAIVRPKRRAAVQRKRGAKWVTQWSMWWAVGLKFGVWLSERTLRRGLRIPVRPHLTRHPALVKQVKAKLSGWIAGKAA